MTARLSLTHHHLPKKSSSLLSVFSSDPNSLPQTISFPSLVLLCPFFPLFPPFSISVYPFHPTLSLSLSVSLCFLFFQKRGHHHLHLRLLHSVLFFLVFFPSFLSLFQFSPLITCISCSSKSSLEFSPLVLFRVMFSSLYPSRICSSLSSSFTNSSLFSTIHPFTTRHFLHFMSLPRGEKEKEGEKDEQEQIRKVGRIECT